MQLIKSNSRIFDTKKVEQVLISENKFITDLLSILSLPTRNDDAITEEEEENVDGKPNDTVKTYKKKDVTRAKSLTELQERLSAITSKKRLTYKEKLAKKNLKNRMKKKTKQDERNSQQKLLRAQKLMNAEIKPELSNGHSKTPVFNEKGNVMFSKIDFSNVGKKKEKKQEKDPKKILKKLEKDKEKFEEFRESGEVEKAVELKEKAAWKNALAKAAGEKVKDDPVLLKKTVLKKEQKKRASKKKWEAREEKVKKDKQERQNKRMENIEKRKKEKKKNKLKKAVKRGKIIPGF